MKEIGNSTSNFYTFYMFYTANISAYSAPLGTRFARLGSLQIASPACAAIKKMIESCSGGGY